MQVREIMTENPQCCTPSASLQEAAKLMRDGDCGEIPVLDDQQRPVGVITDRDICCRAVADNRDAQQTRVEEIMSTPVVSCSPQDSIEKCCQLMDDNQIRRVPVVDESGKCCGIVAQADIAREMERSDAGHVLREISQPAEHASQVRH